MTIYLDNCCFNRPYDDQASIVISTEAKCKLHIQEMIKEKKYVLAASYMLRYECGENPYEMRRETILAFISENSGIYVGIERKDIIEKKAEAIMRTGIKFKDACHVASAIYAGCE